MIMKSLFAPVLVGIAVLSAGAQAQPLLDRVRSPVAIGAPPFEANVPSAQLTPAEQGQMQGYRDALQTRERQLEDQAGPQNPGAEIGALRSQARLNQLNEADQSGY
jgi:hypothetical protein